MPQLAEESNEEWEELSQLQRENREWKHAFGILYEMGGLSPYTDNYCYIYMQQEIYCINEVMRRRRNMLGISRKKLNAETFDEKTLIRMETENRKTHLVVVKTLFERLNLSGELQRVDVVADCKEARDLLDELIRYANNFDLENQRETLKELVQYLNMDIPLNRQLVKIQQAILLYGGSKKNRGQALELLQEALECTIDFEKIQKSERLYLTGGEISCLYNMATYTGNLTLNMYHDILMKVCEEYEREDVIEEHIALYAWIMTSIVKVYSNMGRHEQAHVLVKKVMRSSLECGRLALVEQNLNCISWNRVRLQKKSTPEIERCNRKKILEVCITISKFCKETYYENKLIQMVKEINKVN